MIAAVWRGDAAKRRSQPPRNDAALVNFARTVKEHTHAQEAGHTALHCAARSGHAQIVQKLLGRGAEPNLKDAVPYVCMPNAACARMHAH